MFARCFIRVYSEGVDLSNYTACKEVKLADQKYFCLFIMYIYKLGFKLVLHMRNSQGKGIFYKLVLKINLVGI